MPLGKTKDLFIDDQKDHHGDVEFHIRVVLTVGGLDDGVNGWCEEEDEVGPSCEGFCSESFAVSDTQEDIEVVAECDKSYLSEDGEPGDDDANGV